MDESELEALERELPGLRRVSRFARSLAQIPWFANLGEPVSPGSAAAAAAYADGLGFPHAGVAIVMSWDDAAAAAENLGWNSAAWEAEELLRADLTERALEVMSEEALQFCATLVANAASEPAKAAIEEGDALWDIGDAGAQRLAVGAAAQAAHQAALLLISGPGGELDPDDHPFAAKFRLFEFGRWPIGIAGETLNLF